MSSELHSPSASLADIEKKVDVQHTETIPNLQASGSSTSSGKDAALEILGAKATPIHITPEQDRVVLRKIDLWLMPVIVMVYFLQQLDKYVLTAPTTHILLLTHDRSSLSYTSVFGIATDARECTTLSGMSDAETSVVDLVGSQYSWLGSIVYVAQMIWQPVSSYFLVKLPVAKYRAFSVVIMFN